MSDEWKIWLRNAQYQRIGILDVYNEISLVPKFNKTGTWHLVIPTSSKIASLVTETTGIIVQYNGVTQFSGSSGTEYHETSTEITIGGVDDNVLLETPTRPTPSLAQGPYPDAYDVTTGIASTIMRSLVNRNIGAAAPVEWKIPQLTLAADPLLGGTLTARTRFDPLNVILAELASTPLATGLGFRIRQSDNLAATLVFEIYEPRDKHLETIFSIDMKTAKDYEYIYQTPQANYFIIGGGDNFGINRTVVEGGDDDNIAEVGRRVAVFVDRRGVESPAELTQELAELIAGVVKSRVINITPVPVPSIQYPTDFALGDYVTAAVKGVSYPRLIRELLIEFNPESGITISPTIADPSGTNDDINAQHLDTLSHRLSNIERNWNVPDDSIIEDMLHPTMKWYPGDIKITARAAAQPGWLLCDGSAISRSTYSRLFNAIGTLFGVGNGTTTFNIPSMKDKYPIGAGDNHNLGTSAGDTEINIGSHSHPHSHGLNNHVHAGAAHTHTGHSHGMDDHEHSHIHTHRVNDTHDHGSITSGPSSDTSVDAFTDIDVATYFHWHEIAEDELDVSSSSAEPSQYTSEGVLSSNHGLNFSSTDLDGSTSTPNYSAKSSGPQTVGGTGDPGTEMDTVSAGGGTVEFDPPNVAVNYEIYTGIIPV